MSDFAILCPGQGAQSPDMFDLVLTDDPAGRAAEVIEAFSRAAGIDLVARARASDRLFDNAFAQPALAAVALATWTQLAPRLPAPALFAGYSVGEMSAWICAGAWSLDVAAAVTVTRARLMDAASPPDCGMLAVRGLARADIAALSGALQLAIVNDVDHVVLAGTRTELDAAQARLAAHGANVRRLDVAVPSHTPMLARAADEFIRFLATTPTQEGWAPVPVLGGIDGDVYRRYSLGIPTLARAVSQPVRWDLCQRQIEESGVRVTLELGPGRALTRLSTLDARSIESRSVADFRSIDGVVSWLDRRIEPS